MYLIFPICPRYVRERVNQGSLQHCKTLWEVQREAEALTDHLPLLLFL